MTYVPEDPTRPVVVIETAIDGLRFTALRTPGCTSYSVGGNHLRWPDGRYLCSDADKREWLAAPQPVHDHTHDGEPIEAEHPTLGAFVIDKHAITCDYTCRENPADVYRAPVLTVGTESVPDEEILTPFDVPADSLFRLSGWGPMIRAADNGLLNLGTCNALAYARYWYDCGARVGRIVNDDHGTPRVAWWPTQKEIAAEALARQGSLAL